MINSKVKFYFYKKRQWKQYKTHWKDITEWASSELDPGEAESKGGKGRPVPGLHRQLLWGRGSWLQSRSHQCWSHKMQTMRRTTVVAYCAEEWGLLGTSRQSLVVEKLEISKEYSGFCFAWDNQQVVYHSSREDCWLERIHHTSAWHSLLVDLPPRSPQTWYCKVLYKDSLTTGSEHGVCPLSVCYCGNTLLRFYVKAASLCTDILLGELILFYNLL